MEIMNAKDIENQKRGFAIAFILALLVIVTIMIGVIYFIFCHPIITVYSVFAMVAIGIYKRRDELFYSFNK